MQSLLLTLGILVALVPSVLSASDVKLSSGNFLVYVGTYTEASSKGIYAYCFDSKTGGLKLLGLAGESTNPSFVVIDASGRYLYAVNEIDEFKGAATGVVSAFSIDPATRKLKLLNQVASGGTGPAHLSIDKSGKFVLVANYGGGSVATFPVLQDGRLGEAASFVQHKDTDKSEKSPISHAHSIQVSPDNRFAIVADLGLDRVFVYRFDPGTGKLAPNDPPFTRSEPGAGPRHFKFHPNGKFGYLTNEFHSSITAYSYNSGNGVLTPLQTISAKPDDFAGQNDVAEVRVHPSGKFLYVSNRGHDSIAVFSIDPRRGTLTLVERVPSGGKTPRHFNIDPAGSWLIAAHQDSGNIAVFRIDQRTGRLAATANNMQLSAPVCVMFAEAR